MKRLIQFEFKKIFIKQFGLALIILLTIIKIFSSASLFKPNDKTLSPQQRTVYLEYIDQYGGKLTDEKEAAIIDLYTELSEAKQRQRDIQDALSSGGYATTDEYFQALSELPELIEDKEAIEKLYSGYESVAKDRESRVLLAYDAPAMTVGQEYWLLIFICYISAISVYAERHINDLQRASKNGAKTYAAKLLALFAAVTAVWIIFSAVEFSALISVISRPELSASLASLESFKETPYSGLSIIGGFFAIELTKLLGYLFTAAVTLIIARLSGNLVLSVFSPAALNIVWIYLFGNNTAAFYQPFSLMRGAPYFTGTRYVGTGSGAYKEYSEIPLSVFITLSIIAFSVIILACVLVISAGKNKLKRGKKIPAAMTALTVFTMIMSGCSSSAGSDNFGGAGAIRESNGEFCAVISAGDEDEISCNIALLDENLNVSRDGLIRDVFDTDFRIEGVFSDGNHIYYSAESDGGSRVNRINLETLSEENIYFGDYSRFLGTTKYFDMITVWSSENRDSVRVKDFFVSGGKLIMSTQSNAVYSVDIRTRQRKFLFEDIEVNNLCVSGGKIFYTNLTGELICFDNGEKTPVSNRVFVAICADDERVYGVGTSGVFAYDNEFNETEYSQSGGYAISAYHGKIAFQSKDGWNYVDENGEKNLGEADGVFVCERGIIIERGGKFGFLNEV